MSLSKTLTAGNATAAATVGGGGLLWWLGENASGLGALCLILGLVVTLTFYTLNYFENKRHNREVEKHLKKGD